MNTLIEKSARRIKDTVRLRTKKLKNGGESLYLDIYTDGNRSYEFLKMYLLPEINSLIKEQNNAIYAAAEAIRSRRTIEINNIKAGIKSNRDGKEYKLYEWLEKYKEIQKSKGIRQPAKIKSVVNLILKYEKKGQIPLKRIDKAWIGSFIDWLQNSYKKRDGSGLSKGTAFFYMSQFSSILNIAAKHGHIIENPFLRLMPEEKVRKPISQREFLTSDELKRMIKTDCRKEVVKKAFLFACYCGLRISDILRLRWEDIICNKGTYSISITMKKTSKPIYIPLSKCALKWMPERRKTGLVFDSLPTPVTINRILKNWCEKAYIRKTITFHTSRHTFGTLMISAGADLYTTSQLMGHSDVRTTQIYAKIVDSKKIEAVKMIDKLFAR